MIDENLPQPSPNWDYYIHWHSLYHIKAKIISALLIMSSNHKANAELDNEIKELLDPASGELIDILHRLAASQIFAQRTKIPPDEAT